MGKFKLISIPKITDERGNLSFLQYPSSLPFELKRVYWIYDIPGGEYSGGHAYYKQSELIIAVSGSFDVVINDGSSETIINLNRSYNALYLPPKHWRNIENFSTNSVLLICSDSFFSESDYIRNIDDFKQFIFENEN
jgi:hypothetical protein